MVRELLVSLRAAAVTLVLCAVAYPALVYALGHTIFPRQAEGSLIERDGKVVGSELIGQPFRSEGYFHPRPSAAGANGYAADAASGSNLGTYNPALLDRILLDVARQVIAHDGNELLQDKLDRLDTVNADLKERVDATEKSPADLEVIAGIEARARAIKDAIRTQLEDFQGEDRDRVPADLVTTSGSGLDPHISPESAAYQAPRVARARKLPLDRVLEVVEANTDRSAQWIGAPARVNVLLLNLAIDAAATAR